MWIQNEKHFYTHAVVTGWKQYRFRQFHLDVSILRATETTVVERTRCYTDNTTAPYLPSTTIDIPCKETARYVIVETTYDAPEDDPITGAVLEICEIEVYCMYIYINLYQVYYTVSCVILNDKTPIDSWWIYFYFRMWSRSIRRLLQMMGAKSVTLKTASAVCWHLNRHILKYVYRFFCIVQCI